MCYYIYYIFKVRYPKKYTMARKLRNLKQKIWKNPKLLKKYLLKIQREIKVSNGLIVVNILKKNLKARYINKNLV